MKTFSNIAVIGLGFVGTSTAVLLSKNHTVTGVDKDRKKVSALNDNQSPIEDNMLQEYMDSHPLRLRATDNLSLACKEADLIFIAVGTDFLEGQRHLDTSGIDSVIREISECRDHALIAIRSTVPIGSIHAFQEAYPQHTFLYIPEFLRETTAYEDSVHPSRLVIGTNERSRVYARDVAELLKQEDTPVLIMSYEEAESVKLSSNTYLAMRVAFFNELDSFAEAHHLDIQHIIEGICLDERIGNFYNNPSFGYGGYCLPKDSQQLLSNFYNTPHRLVDAVVTSNQKRKEWVARSIMDKVTAPDSCIGIYRLGAKANSTNLRSSSIVDVIHILKENGCSLIIYEPSLSVDSFEDIEVINDLNTFKQRSTLIVANRFHPDLNDVEEKVYTRDLYHTD